MKSTASKKKPTKSPAKPTTVKETKTKAPKPGNENKYAPRHKIKYPTLTHLQRAPAVRREEMEIDYLDKIKNMPDVMEWLNQFNEENHNANFANKEKLLDKSDEFRKERYRANNYRNSDIYIRAKVRGLLNAVENDAHLEHYLEKSEKKDVNSTEDAMIARITLKRQNGED